MAADIDIRAVSAFISLPDNAISTLLDAPTTDAIVSFLHVVESRAKEFEKSKAQKVKLEVELETVVRTSESKAKVLQNSRDKALAEASKLRIDLQASESSKSRLESEIEQARSSTSNEATEITSLKSRISSLEAANRDTSALLNSKNGAYDKLGLDLSEQHHKNSELRKQITSLGQNVQTATSAVTSAKFREQSLQQEADLLKKNNEWLENERKIKADEHSTFRKEKNARISELSRSNEQYITEIESLKRSEKTLLHRVEDLTNKLDEALQETQRVRDEKLAEADSFRAELENVNRLAELQKASADTAKQRVQELSGALDELREDATDEIGRIRAEVETEHADREAAEQRVTELEARIQQLEADLDEARVRPATPTLGMNGSGLATPLRPGTPLGIFSPSTTSRLKGQLSTTQLYSEYKKLEKELAAEKRSSEQLQSNLDAMLEDLEDSRPAIDELRSDHSRLQSELLEVSNLMEITNQDRDAAVKEMRAYQGQLASKEKEIEVITQQTRDLSTQIRYLLIEQFVRERGDTITHDEYTELEKEADEGLRKDVENLSETQQVVNQKLIAFRTVGELQAQNESQLSTIRNLVSTLESNETKEKEMQQLNLQHELETARKQISAYQDEIKSMVAQSKSFVKERDMFRNMLTRRGHLPASIEPTDFSRSLPIPAGGPAASAVTEALSTATEAEYNKLLKDMQYHFDTFRQEAAVDRSALRAQVDDLSKRATQLQAEASRTLGQLTGATQRADMLQSNYNMLKTENAEIQKRSYAAMENTTKQEMKIQQIAEELVEARGLLDSTMRESANLKAEKDLWKNVEKRLIDDNESLRNERSRVDQLNGSLQSILNEREQTDTETRRRLQSQIESLESEMHATKRKLNDEIEESRKASLRKEYEHDQSQKRIDDLVTSLGSAREELAAAATSRDHLQARVDELTVELRSAEERLEVLTRPAPEANDEEGASEETSLSQEQQLAVQVSELKRDLELQQADVERANEQVEVYKNISQTSEERLQELTETDDQYRSETDATIAEKEAKIKDLEQRIEDISAELNTTNNELSQLRDQQSQSDQKLEEQRTTLSAEIDRLREQDEKHAEQAQFNQEASKAQAQIATEAQQNYENELLKHAEAARNLHAVRAELNQLRLEIIDVRTVAETNKADLEQKEESWTELKERYEREISDLKKRREEVLQQNGLLHGQLENVTQQITALQRDRAALASDERPGMQSSELENLQEVITYLRREKEIVDVQYHLSIQESKRLRQQLDFTQSQLDETRLKLDQQRRADADSERNAMSHNKLMEVLNELNLHRESSVTLRAEAKQATQALSERTKHVEELEAQIQPLQARISELEHSAELREGQMKLLQEDRDHWQQRTQNILSKYDRVDPVELESLKEKLVGLQAERDEAVAAQASLQTQIDSIPEQIDSARQELKSRLQEQFKTKWREQTTKTREKQAEVDAALAEKTALESELTNLRQELEEAQNQQMNSETQPAKDTAAPADPAPTESQPVENASDLESKISELEQALAGKDQEIEDLKIEQENKFKTRETEMRNVLNKRLAEVKKDAETAKSIALDELKEALSLQHQQEVETLRSHSVPVDQIVQAATNGDVSEPTVQEITTATNPTEVTDEMLENITEAQARLLVQKNEIIRSILKTNIRKSVEKEKEALRKELTEVQGAVSDDVAAAEQIKHLEEQFALERESLIKEKETEFATEREALLKQHEEKLARERQDLVIKHQEELSNQKLEFSQESERKIAEQVSNAEKLAEKRMTVKLNMATNQARLANAKLDVVKKAVEETPDTTVSEVWTSAKDAKPTPLQPPNKPAVAPPASTPANSQAASTSSAAPPQTPKEEVKSALPTAEPAQQEDADSETKVEDNAESSTAGTHKPVSNNVGTGPAALRQLSSGLPRGGSFRGRGGGPQSQQAHNGTIPQQQSQGQHQQQSQQAPGRGSGIPRGGRGGRGGGRGAPGLQTNIPQAGGGRGAPASATGSPGRLNLNPQAQQFTPGGNKRAREDGSESGETGNQGKRIRGGGVGAGT